VDDGREGEAVGDGRGGYAETEPNEGEVGREEIVGEVGAVDFRQDSCALLLHEICVIDNYHECIYG